MKFITRALYQGTQIPSDEVDVRWKRACEGYRAHLDRIRPELPPGMQAFADTTLHDGVVRAVRNSRGSELVLDIDATRNPWGAVGVFRVTFTGVREVEGIGQLVGDEWLYEEVHLDPAGGFDFRVLFWRSDFRVVAEEVDMHILSMPGDGA